MGSSDGFPPSLPCLLTFLCLAVLLNSYYISRLRGLSLDATDVSVYANVTQVTVDLWPPDTLACCYTIEYVDMPGRRRLQGNWSFHVPTARCYGSELVPTSEPVSAAEIWVQPAGAYAGLPEVPLLYRTRSEEVCPNGLNLAHKQNNEWRVYDSDYFCRDHVWLGPTQALPAVGELVAAASASNPAATWSAGEGCLLQGQVWQRSREFQGAIYLVFVFSFGLVCCACCLCMALDDSKPARRTGPLPPGLANLQPSGPPAHALALDEGPVEVRLADGTTLAVRRGIAECLPAPPTAEDREADIEISADFARSDVENLVELVEGARLLDRPPHTPEEWRDALELGLQVVEGWTTAEATSVLDMTDRWGVQPGLLQNTRALLLYLDHETQGWLFGRAAGRRYWQWLLPLLYWTTLLCVAYYVSDGERHWSKTTALVLACLAPLPVFWALSTRRFSRGRAERLAWFVTGPVLCTATALWVFGRQVPPDWWLVYFTLAVHFVLGLGGRWLYWGLDDCCLRLKTRVRFRSAALETEWVRFGGGA